MERNSFRESARIADDTDPDANAGSSSRPPLSLDALCLLCTLMCRVRSSLRENLRAHSWHANGFSPVCVRMWVVRWSLRLNARGHDGHGNGFDPVWIRMWRVSSSLREKRRSHESTRQANGRSAGGTLHGRTGYLRGRMGSRRLVGGGDDGEEEDLPTGSAATTRVVCGTCCCTM